MGYSNIEDRDIYNFIYYNKNKEKILEQTRKYHQDNPDKYKNWSKTPNGIKSRVIRQWKFSGLINDDYKTLYNNYLACTACQVCKEDFKSDFDRCMDHDHDTGLFRQFLCRSCNTYDNWRKKINVDDK